MDRRTLLHAGLAAPALLGFGRALAAGAGTPFTLGVGSGDPSPDGMVLWTRLAPEPLAPDGGMPPAPVPVHWEIAHDAGFTHIAARGTARAEPAWGHSVHVEPRGLAPDRRYFYRFVANGIASHVGRTRTAPAPGTTVERLRLCFGSCQKYEAGRYGAWAHAVADDPDLILFLGDYIYEGKPDPKALRPHLNPEPFDLAGYRIRYATYQLDSQLQAAHAAAPWVTTWDDHEVANDYDDFRDENNTDPAAFLRRRAAAYQAYWEHMPLRARSRPRGAAALLYRTIDWGGLARFQVLDDRQYRGPRACQPPELARDHEKYLSLVGDCPDLHAARTMLGAAQERWLDTALAAKGARWNLLAQQTLMSPLPRFEPEHPEAPPRWSADTWSGYPAARDRLFRRWVSARTPNPIALGGDIHSFAAADIRDPDRPGGPPIAAEFVGGSITSLFHNANFKAEAAHAGIRYAENEVHGYGRVDLTPTRADIVFRGLDDATKAGTGARDLVKFAVEAGRPGMVS